MSYYFLAYSDDDALDARKLPGGPMPGNGRFEAIPEQGILATPHFDQLCAMATDSPFEGCTAEFVSVWPAKGEPLKPVVIQAGRTSSACRTNSAMRSPNSLLTRTLRPGGQKKLWGVGPREAKAIAEKVIAFAKQSRSARQHMYWWMEL